MRERQGAAKRRKGEGALPSPSQRKEDADPMLKIVILLALVAAVYWLLRTRNRRLP